MIDIKEINANEIIDYLNALTQDDSPEKDKNEYGIDLDDISCEGPYTFESLQIHPFTNGIGSKFSLSFSAYYNNWGTDQLIENNFIEISPDGSVIASLSEPFDGDGSAEVLENLLGKWLLTHKFSNTYKEDFKSLVDEANTLLKDCQYGDTNILYDIISKLTKAITLIK
jgi:hypothetical protein